MTKPSFAIPFAATVECRGNTKPSPITGMKWLVALIAGLSLAAARADEETSVQSSPPPIIYRGGRTGSDMAMPAAQAAAEMGAQGVLKAVSPSVYLVAAGKSLDDLKHAGRVMQGSAVAVSTSQALTNCHVIDGRDTIVVKHGDEWGFASATKADKATDRCVLRWSE